MITLYPIPIPSFRNPFDEVSLPLQSVLDAVFTVLTTTFMEDDEEGPPDVWMGGVGRCGDIHTASTKKKMKKETKKKVEPEELPLRSRRFTERPRRSGQVVSRAMRRRLRMLSAQRWIV